MNQDFIVRLDAEGKCSAFESMEEYESSNENRCETKNKKYSDDTHCEKIDFVDEYDKCQECKPKQEEYNQSQYEDYDYGQCNGQYCNCCINKCSSKEEVCKPKKEKKSSDTHKKNRQKREYDKCKKSYDKGYNNGYDEGYEYGMKCGYDKGLTEGFKKGVEAGVARLYKEIMLRSKNKNRRCKRRFYK